jgi:hypothetical protein
VTLEVNTKGSWQVVDFDCVNYTELAFSTGVLLTSHTFNGVFVHPFLGFHYGSLDVVDP